MKGRGDMEGNPIVVTAPSGSGKTSIISWVLAAEAGRISFSVSVTTRAPRAGEVPGRDYHFWTREAFQSGVANNAFLEWAEVHGNLYGTPAEPALRALREGRDVLFDVDVQGARSLRKALAAAIFVFILPPSYEVLEARLRGRGTETEARIASRLETAREEIQCFEEFDYLVVNDNLDEARQALAAIVRAARLRLRTAEGSARAIVSTFLGKG